ncbi:MAG TPA: DUF502 domain-containing protein [Candidatus Eisenbacteria bacterium]|nr:DUF502 domain-containing protein [Candidatus Eisenbacteria bacterium]
MSKFRTHFISGILVLAPLFLTLVVLNYVMRLADAFVVNPLFHLLPLKGLEATTQVLLAKVVIAVSVIGFVTLIGIAAERLFFRQFLDVGEGVLRMIPFVNKLYGSLREIAQAFFGDKKGVFKEVIYLEYPRDGVYSLGFVTQDRRWDADDRVGKDLVTVFVPSPPNPATGYFVFVPREKIIRSGITVEDGLRLVISAGAAVPPRTLPDSKLRQAGQP